MRLKVFFKKWCFNETLQGVQEKCYENFVRILRKADKVIVMDAFITKITLIFLHDLQIPYTLIKRKMTNHIIIERRLNMHKKRT